MPTETVKVVVRKRPLNSSEIARGNKEIIEVDRELSQIRLLSLPSGTPKAFTFDSVYDHDSSQRLVYDETAFPLVESVIKGYNGTIFAYGQTGCGKTYTMLGVSSSPELCGIIPNSFSHIFGCISESQHQITFLVRCSYCEIYNEEIRDLLRYDPNNKLELKENKDKGIFIKNLSMCVVKNVTDIENAMANGNTHRITKETNMNEKSSRSHAIFTIYIETSQEADGRNLVKAGKLNLVDLAGSERQKKTGAVGERLKEAIEINLSLSALGNVISALVDGKISHIPYRDSKLTRLLQDSLGGNTKTVMIAVVSPADYNYDESLSSLRYASRAKFIKNKPRVNEDPKDALLREFSEEIARLKKLLEDREPVIVEKVIERPESHRIRDMVTEGIIKGGDIQDSQLEEKLRAQRDFRKKYKRQKQREKKLIEERDRKNHELEIHETKYNNLQDEVDDLRKAVDSLTLQKKSALAEIADLTHEFELEKESLLENVRSLEYECGLMDKVIGFVLPQREFDRIRRKSKFDHNNNYWKVPPFIIQNKSTVFPKIGKRQAAEFIANEIKDKAVFFQEENVKKKPVNEAQEYKIGTHSYSTTSFKNTNQVVMNHPTKYLVKNKNHLKLEPLQNYRLN